MNIYAPRIISSIGKSLTVGSIIGNVKEAIRETINLAFDRLDRTMLLAAERLEGLTDALARDLEGLMDSTVDELDEERRKAMNEVAALARQLDEMAEDRLEQVDGITNALASTLQELLTDVPGYLNILPAVAIEGDSTAEFRIEGVNVNRLELNELRLSGSPVKPRITSRDGDSLIFEVDIPDLTQSQQQDDDPGDVDKLLLSFSVAEDGFWPWSKKKGRPFATTLYIYPKVVGTVTAIWTGEVSERETEMLDRTQTYLRLKSGTFGGRKQATHDHTERAPEGWRFDFNRAELNVWSSGGCNNRASGGVWRTRQPTIVAADIHQVTQSGPSIGCYVKSTIRVPMYKDTPSDRSFASESSPIGIGQRIALQIPESAAGAKDLQLSHVEIASHVFGTTETRLLLPGERVGGMKLEVDHASNTAFVSVDFV